MSLFNPIDVQGPAHRGAQVQQLAQAAAQNVMRRQKMRSLLQQGARGAAQSGAGQSLQSSARQHPTGLRGATLRDPGFNRGSVSLPAGLLGAQTGDTFGSAPMDGSQNASGGGVDYPSIPSPTDASQSPTSTMPDPTTFVPGPSGTPGVPTNPLGSNGGNFLGAPPTGNVPSDSVPADSNQPTNANQPIHLGGGLYYDPLTDSVHGGNPLGR